MDNIHDQFLEEGLLCFGYPAINKANFLIKSKKTNKRIEIVMWAHSLKNFRRPLTEEGVKRFTYSTALFAVAACGLVLLMATVFIVGGAVYNVWATWLLWVILALILITIAILAACIHRITKYRRTAAIEQVVTDTSTEDQGASSSPTVISNVVREKKRTLPEQSMSPTVVDLPPQTDLHEDYYSTNLEVPTPTQQRLNMREHESRSYGEEVNYSSANPYAHVEYMMRDDDEEITSDKVGLQV